MSSPFFMQYVEKLLGAQGDALDVSKANLGAMTNATAGVSELDFAQVLEVVNTAQTPVLNRIKATKALAITHKWRQATIRAAASNTSNEGAAAKSAVSVTPALGTNTCQIVKGTVGVNRSAKIEAINGIYGTDSQDAIAQQLELETSGIMADIENAMLYGVLSATDPRAMDGFVGAVGTWDGFIQTNRTDHADATFSAAGLEAMLLAIWNTKPAKLPDAILCSLAAQKAINGYSSAYRLNVLSAEDLTRLTAGAHVSQYVAPWGDLLDIIPHPLNTNSATSANNWCAAVNLDLMARADFDPLHTRLLPQTADADLYEVLWEGTLEFRAEKSHGLLYNFDQL